jgi:hypothetical protein
MIKTFTITDPLIDIFEQERILQFQRNDKLSQNYSKENFVFAEQESFSIGYKDQNPYLFSTIFRRDWWPVGVYRIMNRTWKTERQETASRHIDPLFLEMMESQVEWLHNNRDFRLAIITREHDARNTLLQVMSELNTRGNNFNLFENRVWVCRGDPEHCFQDVLYTGDSDILKEWI